MILSNIENSQMKKQEQIVTHFTLIDYLYTSN